MELINYWYQQYPVEAILLGNGTTSKYWESKLSINKTLPVKLVDERNTTIRARERYLELKPLPFLLRWFPKSLILPPHNLDSIVALILIEDYFKKKFKWPTSIEIKTFRLNTQL